MGPFWSIAVIVGPILLLAVLIYGWTKNRTARRSTLERSERGARELRHEIEDRPDRDVDL